MGRQEEATRAAMRACATLAALWALWMGAAWAVARAMGWL